MGCLVSTWARPELQVSLCVGSVSARAFIHQQCSVVSRLWLRHYRWFSCIIFA